MKKLYFLLLLRMFIPGAVSQVTPEWEILYNSPSWSGDFGKAIAVDADGNVVVAGASLNSSTNTTDCMVVKFNASGGYQWSQQSGGAGNWEDGFNAITVDDVGNIYVTGYSDEGATNKDYVTIKYLADGSLAWKSHYSGLGSDDDDAASDIATDPSGNVYVTGSSAGYSSTYWTDFATIKYNAAGDTLWTARLGGSGMPNDRATALAVDGKGYAYVTGYVEGPVEERYNYATVKYTPDGDTAWVRTYNGAGSDEDRAYAVAVDDDRNVIVTGSSWGTFNDYATLKYDSTGALKWVARYNGPANSEDYAWDLKVDLSGYIYVTGYSTGTNLKYDCLTIKYNPQGGEEWVARYNGPDNLHDYATKLGIDDHSNVFITGYSENAPSPYISTTDILTVKYDSEGNEKWVHRYNGPGNYNDQAGDIWVDESGLAYVTGSCTYYQQTAPPELVALKFSAPNAIAHPVSGPVWFNGYPNPASDDFMVTVSMNAINGILEITDLSGRLVLSRKLNGVNYHRIDLGEITAGMYTCRLTVNGTGSAVSKLLIER